MGNHNSSHSDKIHHFIYIYTNNGIDIPNITTELLTFISPNIELIKSHKIDINIFNITNNNLNDKEIVKLLKKNNIGKLPALKIKNNNKTTLYIGNADIINYYYQLFGDKMIITKMQQHLQQMQPQPHMKPQMQQHMQQQPHMKPQMQHRQHQKQSNNEEYDYSNYLLNEFSMGDDIADDNNDDDTSAINSKNIMSKYDNMVKLRSGGQQQQQQQQQPQQQPQKQKHKHKKSSITPDMLKDSPFRDGDLDDIGLDDNLDSTPISQSLKNINYKKAPSNNQYSLGDDDDGNDTNDSILEQMFWEKNL
jgi:hypothetical protein